MLGIAGMFSVLTALGWKQAGWQALGFRESHGNVLKLICKCLVVGYLIAGLNNALLSYFHLPNYPRQVAQLLVAGNLRRCYS